MTGTNDTIALGTFIACQRCGHQIELTEALAQPFLERSMSGARREIELLRTNLESANAKEAQLLAAQAAIALEKNQLQLTVSEQVNEQLTAVRAAVAGQYEEQIDKQKRAQQDEVASLKLLVDTANAKEAQLQAARTAIELEKNQLQLTISAQVNQQLTAVRAAVAGQYEEQIDRQRKSQQDEVASLKLLVDTANAKEAEFQAARTAIELEKNQLQLTISAQVNEQLTTVRAAVAGQYEEQIDKQKKAQQHEVASLKLLVETANAQEAELQAARTAMELEKNQLQLTISAQVNEQLTAVRAAVAGQYEGQINNQKKAQQEEVASLKHLVDAANAKEAEFLAARVAMELEKNQLQLTISAQVNEQLTAVRTAVAGQYEEQIDRQRKSQQDEVASLKLLVDTANAKEAEFQAARVAMELEKNQLQLTISAQVNEQLATVKAVVADQYQEQINNQKKVQQEEVASLKLLVDTANAKEAEFQAARVAMELEKNQLHLTISAQVNEQLATVKAAVADQYQEQINNQKKVQQEEVASLKHLVDAANAKEAEFANRLRQRNLEIEQREQNLTAKQDQMESDYLGKWEAKRTELIQQGMLHAEHKIHLRITEKNILIEQLQGKIKELETTAFQGSQQVQGEAFEREVENRLRRHFPWDKFLPVSTGSYGADLVQSIYSNQGETSGKIIWECKNTKHWSQDWLKKVKQDQQNENAQAAVIVSVALPDSVRNFDLLEDVWVCSPEYFIELATAIRFYLCEVFAMRNFNKDKDIKNELLFSYVTGQQFRAKFKAIIEVQKELRQGLEKEKKAMSAAWSKRDKQLDLLLTGAAGIGGDLLGILGKTFRPIEELELEDADTRLIESSYDEPSESQSALHAALKEASMHPASTRFIPRT